ncbi:sodium- and chloride-dependent betaine transporter isoform X1 [Scophthalmus maximus]|uniref:sodium- and chloride-dependent betaine transporter isoform X1 n=2 Tax=Scophthalmus maximus TaxID=52904 RepID=UPI001FA8FA54|nr:sodium- and chloride-dependent betaine transporter isoform X1 [Scophthalmus maximus]XP_035460235.2 sodium- and chloride-dependent betaine transporter isoform X1 [Scophthalmus maximus]
MTEETATGPTDRGVGPDKGAREKGSLPRGKWANNKEFLLSMTGVIVGFGSLCHFPFLCFKNGGAVFLIPYFVILMFFGLPLFFLETALGQYTSEGGVTAWRKICPMFEGLGIATQMIVFYLNTYHVVWLAYAIFYLVNCFKSPLPWTSCDNWWNTDSCHSHVSAFANPHMFRPDFNWSFLNNITSSEFFENDSFFSSNETDQDQMAVPEVEFWMNRVLRMSGDMSLGTVHWDLALCLLLAWLICYFCVWKGIRSSGKVVYFTATFPYLLLLLLFFRGVTLPGAATGLGYYLTPDFSRLADPFMWLDAMTNVIYSYALSHGVLTALGSYNRYNNDCYSAVSRCGLVLFSRRDCLVLCGLNSATCIFSGVVVYSVLGFLAEQQGMAVGDVAAAGSSLAFIAFPVVLSLLPAPSFWAVVFFLMFFFLGLDSQFLCVEGLATAITDMFPRHLRRPGAREILVLVMVVVFFLLGLPLVTEGGIVIFYLVDNYGASPIGLLFIACLECVIIAWVYGADRFYDNIEDMIGYPPFPVLKYCWLFITPLLCGVTFLYNLSAIHSINVYGYQPGSWGPKFGAVLIAVPLMCIPLFVLVSLWRNAQNMTTPSSDLRQARPHKPLLTLCKYVIVKSQGPPARTVDDSNEKMRMEEPSGV